MTASNSHFKEFPWPHFKEFISPTADRLSIIKTLLEEKKLPYKTIEINGSRHLLAPSPLPRSPEKAQTILAAHYDRAEGSSGANDNSSGVFLLVETALKLKEAGTKNWIIIFTDKEELKSGEGIQEQGSFALGEKLKNSGMENARIFSFDTCGTGDTLLISTTAELLLKGEKGSETLRDSILELRGMALDAARELGMAKVLLAPTPFSDDAGFLRAGLAAQTITMLPAAECVPLVSELRKNPGFASALINEGFQKNSKTASIPETWRCLNGPSDSYLRLTPEHFKTVVRFAAALCGA